MRSPLLLAVAFASACSVTVDKSVDSPPASRHQAAVVSSDLVIADVYGGGGTFGATFQNDYVVLFNRGAASATLSGLRLTYASATGNFATTGTGIVDLPDADIPPGGSFLVRMASSGGNGAALPTPDATGSTNMGSSAGKIALTPITGGIGACGDATTACDPAKWIDLVGWGSGATQAEGTKAAATAAATGLTRGSLGCADSGDNSADFTVVTPATPRTSATTATPCGGMDLAGQDQATPADLSTAVDLSGADAAVGPILLNEVKWNPAGADNGQEFIELIGSGTVAANTWVLSVEGDANSTPGRINYARDLGGQAFGSNGLILIKSATSTIAGVAAATAVITDSVFNGAPLQNGTESLLLVHSSSPLTITPSMTNLSSLNNITILDSIAASAAATGTTYGGAAFAVCPAMGSAVDGAARIFGDSRAQTLGAWIAGQTIGTATDQYLTSVTDCSGGPATASLSPGRPNNDPLMPAPDLAGGPVDMTTTGADLSSTEDLSSSDDLATPTQNDLATSHTDAATGPASDMAKPHTLTRDSGCAIAPTGGTGSTGAMLLVLALWLIARRRARA